MDLLAIIKGILVLIALSLLIFKLKAKDFHTAVYWALVTLYWAVNFIESIAKLAA